MSQNPLLSGTRLPGVTFQLPSQGLFYENDELDSSSVNGEVHVFPMTAYDEILLRTPDLLLNGTAVDAVIKRCVPQVLKPSELLSKDVDYIMTALRSVSLGNELEITSTHDCDPEVEHSYVINISDFQQKAKQIDPTIKNQQYTCTVDGKKVYLHPIKYGSLVKLLNIDLENANNATNPDITQNAQAEADKYHHQLMEQLAGLISKVEIPGNPTINVATTIVTEQLFIIDWLKTLNVKEIKILNGKIGDMSEWGADLTYPITCKKCGGHYTATVPLNPNRFFM